MNVNKGEPIKNLLYHFKRLGKFQIVLTSLASPHEPGYKFSYDFSVSGKSKRNVVALDRV